jgi:class 3 adenylate cyclase
MPTDLPSRSCAWVRKAKSRMARDPGAVRTGHVLFMDLVGSSVLPVEEQMRLVVDLLDRIRASRIYRDSLAAGNVLSVPSGDGVALVFFDNPDSASACALDIVPLLRGIAVRMGIHSGPVGLVDDIRGGATVVGEGINGAKRVMDCAGPGEVLVSTDWVDCRASGRAGLVDRGTVTAKHGRLLRLWQLLGDSAENLFRPAVMPRAQSGALPVDSPRYLEREPDRGVRDALLRHDSIVLIKGGRQTGKSSLLAHAIAQVRAQGTAVAVADLLGMDDSDFVDANRFLHRVAETVEDQVSWSKSVAEFWNGQRAPGANLERWLRRHVLPSAPFGLVLAIDQADRLLRHRWCGEVFGLFRAWHNRRATDPDPDWANLTVTISYTAEAHHFIADPNQSPFNVGTPRVLSDFSIAESEELRSRVAESVDSEIWQHYHRWVGGHPYLVQLGLDALSSGEWKLERLIDATREGQGPLSDHLFGLSRWVEADESHRKWVRELATPRPALDSKAFSGLRSVGLVGADHRASAHWRCPLYADWLADYVS